MTRLDRVNIVLLVCVALLIAGAIVTRLLGWRNERRVADARAAEFGLSRRRGESNEDLLYRVRLLRTHGSTWGNAATREGIEVSLRVASGVEVSVTHPGPGRLVITPSRRLKRGEQERLLQAMRVHVPTGLCADLRLP